MRIALDVSQHRQQVVVLLDRKGLETPLPHMAARGVVFVITANVSREQPLHPAAQIAVFVRPQDQMEVVGHEEKLKGVRTLFRSPRPPWAAGHGDAACSPILDAAPSASPRLRRHRADPAARSGGSPTAPLPSPPDSQCAANPPATPPDPRATTARAGDSPAADATD